MERPLEISVDLGESIRTLASVAPQVLRSEMRTVLGVIARRVEKEVVEKTPRGVGAAGGLAGSIHGEVIPRGDGVIGIVGTPIEYGEVVELGRRPGKRMPPVEPIALWAVRKLGIPEEEAGSVGLAIARKIKHHGFEGAHMFQRTIEELDSWIMAQLRTIPARVARRIERGTR